MDEAWHAAELSGIAEDIRRYADGDAHNDFRGQRRNFGLGQRQRLMTCITMLVSQGLIYAWLIYAVVTGRMTLGGFTLYVSSYNTFAGAVWMVMRGIAELLARSREVDDFRSLWI